MWLDSFKLSVKDRFLPAGLGPAGVVSEDIVHQGGQQLLLLVIFLLTARRPRQITIKYIETNSLYLKKCLRLCVQKTSLKLVCSDYRAEQQVLSTAGLTVGAELSSNYKDFLKNKIEVLPSVADSHS